MDESHEKISRTTTVTVVRSANFVAETKEATVCDMTPIKPIQTSCAVV